MRFGYGGRPLIEELLDRIAGGELHRSPRPQRGGQDDPAEAARGNARARGRERAAVRQAPGGDSPPGSGPDDCGGAAGSARPVSFHLSRGRADGALLAARHPRDGADGGRGAGASLPGGSGAGGGGRQAAERPEQRRATARPDRPRPGAGAPGPPARRAHDLPGPQAPAPDRRHPGPPEPGARRDHPDNLPRSGPGGARLREDRPAGGGPHADRRNSRRSPDPRWIRSAYGTGAEIARDPRTGSPIVIPYLEPESGGAS